MKNKNLEEKNKKNVFKQINKEALITLILYVIFFVWWYYFAYMYAPSDVNEYKFILGLPEWFFYSCVLGLVLINILVYIAVKLFFKEINFKNFEENK